MVLLLPNTRQSCYCRRTAAVYHTMIRRAVRRSFDVDVTRTRTSTPLSVSSTQDSPRNRRGIKPLGNTKHIVLRPECTPLQLLQQVVAARRRTRRRVICSWTGHLNHGRITKCRRTCVLRCQPRCLGFEAIARQDIILRWSHQNRAAIGSGTWPCRRGGAFLPTTVLRGGKGRKGGSSFRRLGRSQVCAGADRCRCRRFFAELRGPCGPCWHRHFCTYFWMSLPPSSSLHIPRLLLTSSLRRCRYCRFHGFHISWMAVYSRGQDMRLLSTSRVAAPHTSLSNSCLTRRCHPLPCLAMPSKGGRRVSCWHTDR